MHKDFLDKDLNIGDEVVYTGIESADLYRGRITKLNKVKITIKNKQGNITYKYPKNVVKNPNVWEII